LPTILSGLIAGVAIGLLAAWVYLLFWKARYTSIIRADAVQRSQAVTAGKVHEQLIPYLPSFPYNPKDVRFLGSPIDLVVFDGLAEGQVRRVVFVEVKTRRDLENAPPPQASVHTRKQNKLGKLAQSYLRSKRLREQPCRFDVVAVVVNDEGGVTAIRHIPNAFSVAAW